MKLYFSSREKARNWKANTIKPENAKVVDNGKETTCSSVAAKRWSVDIIANNGASKNYAYAEAMDAINAANFEKKLAALTKGFAK